MLVTPVACPDPPLLNHHGVHEPFFLRAIVRLRTEDGLEGVGEGPGGGLYVQQLRAAAATRRRRRPLPPRSAARPGRRSARLFDHRSRLLDLIGKATGRPVYDLLGGPARRRVPFSAYLFYKEAGDDDWGRAVTPEELVKQAERFPDRYGMTVFKLKGGVLEPDLEIATVKLLRSASARGPDCASIRTPPGRSRRRSASPSSCARRTSNTWRTRPPASRGWPRWRGTRRSRSAPTCA